jgi:hypothetical protein
MERQEKIISGAQIVSRGGAFDFNQFIREVALPQLPYRVNAKLSNMVRHTGKASPEYI